MLWKERRWVALLELIDGLPTDSRYWQAMTDDPFVAERVLADVSEEDEAQEWYPPLSQYGLTEQLLTQIVDGLTILQQTVVAVGGGKPSRPKPSPRPRTQIDILREKRDREEQDDIITLFAPHAV